MVHCYLMKYSVRCPRLDSSVMEIQTSHLAVGGMLMLMYPGFLVVPVRLR